MKISAQRATDLLLPSTEMSSIQGQQHLQSFLDGGPSIIAGSVADVQFFNVEKGTAGRCGYHKGVQYSSIFWDGESECHPSR